MAIKRQKPSIKFTKTDLVELAASLKYQDSSSWVRTFWDQVNQLRSLDVCSFTDDQIRFWLSEYDNLIDSKAHGVETYVNGLPRTHQSDLNEATQLRGRIDHVARARVYAPMEAHKKGGELYWQIVHTYGWQSSKDELVHDELELVIDKKPATKQERKPVLYSGKESRTPCIAIIPSQRWVLADDFAGLMMSAMFNSVFIDHIGRFDPSYPARNQAWRRKYEDKASNLSS